MKETSALSMVIANDVSKGGMGTEENDVYIIDSDVKHISGTKRYMRQKSWIKSRRIL